MQVDVLVVGAGPAGAATALQLARAGVGVTIIERAAFPRRKICGEYLGAGALAALDALGLGEDVRKQGSALHGGRIAAAGTRLELRFSRAGLSRASGWPLRSWRSHVMPAHGCFAGASTISCATATEGSQALRFATMAASGASFVRASWSAPTASVRPWRVNSA